LEPGDPVIFVADVRSIQPPPEPPLARVTGVLKDAPDNFPDISYTMAGEPTVTVEPSGEPWDYQMARVIDGSGQEVYAGAKVLVQYMGINMTTGKEFDSSWSRGQPSSLATTNLVPGFRDALVGQKVGSRVLVVIPPALGYGSQGTVDKKVGPEDAMFFVIDILGVL
jgi:peptidylprolyl isomerase